MKTLVIVDVQKDFLPGGALPVPDGDKVIPEIVRLAKDGGYGLVLTTGDSHPEGTKHFEKWPVHCVAGTAGAKLHPDITALGDYHIVKGETLADDGYSAFEGMDDSEGRSINELVRSVKRNLSDTTPDELHVVGLALDYCVKATALDAAEEGYETTVVLDATRPVDRATGEEATRVLADAGVRLARYRTKSGRMLTDADVWALAEEAERGV